MMSRMAKPARRAPAAREIAIRDDMIRLGQFLKLADQVEVGSDVKLLLDTATVRVNGDIETRRGRQLTHGDEVLVGSQLLRVV